MASEPSRKRPRPAPAEEADNGGGLYDFLPPPDPEKDKAAKLLSESRALPALPPEDPSRVIFLDIDGVLVPAGSMEMIFIDGASLPVRSRCTDSDFSAAALGSLRTIVQQTGAGIVLSSEWRRTEEMRDSVGVSLRTRGLPQLRDFTAIHTPKAELLKGDPAIAWCERRAREIGTWLKQHKEVTAWVALDDLDFNWADSVREAGTPVMKCHSVLTNAKSCLTEDDAREAVRLLLNPPSLSDAEVAAHLEEAVRATKTQLGSCGKAGIVVGGAAVRR